MDFSWKKTQSLSKIHKCKGDSEDIDRNQRINVQLIDVGGGGGAHASKLENKVQKL